MRARSALVHDGELGLCCGLVRTKSLNPHVVVVKPIKDRTQTYNSGLLNGPRDRRILVQRPVRSDVAVIVGIGSQYPA